MTPEEKNLGQLLGSIRILNMGFATNDGYYGIPSDGKKIAVIHEGEILKFCRNESSARNFVTQHKKSKRNKK